jgi:hypothetical protein
MRSRISKVVITLVMMLVVWPAISKPNDKATVATTDSIWLTRRETFASRQTIEIVTRRCELMRWSGSANVSVNRLFQQTAERQLVAVRRNLSLVHTGRVSSGLILEGSQFVPAAAFQNWGLVNNS